MRYPERPRTRTAYHTALEMEGYIGLGMKREAVMLTRQGLDAPRVHPEVFHAALNTILTFGGRTLARYRTLIETAHQTLSTKGKRKSRALMLCYYAALEDHQSAYAFIPCRFAGPTWLVEMVFALATCLALGKQQQASSIAHRAKDALKVVTNPTGQEILRGAIRALHPS